MNSADAAMTEIIMSHTIAVHRNHPPFPITHADNRDTPRRAVRRRHRRRQSAGRIQNACAKWLVRASRGI